MINKLLIVLPLIGLVWGQQLNLDDLSKQSKDLGGPDMTEIESMLGKNGVNISNINMTQFNTDKIEKVLRDKCEKQGAKQAVDVLKNESALIQECFTKHVNVSAVQQELDEAKKTGSMEEVFAKYCNKWPEVYSCIENVTSVVRQCLTETEEKSFNKTLTIVDELQEFMCYKDGDRLAMFVAEGGVQCVEQQQAGIVECLNSTFGERVPNPDDLSVSTLPILAFTAENCQDFDKLRLCVNDVLEKCKDTTPANIVDAFFKFLKKQMPCEAPPVKLAADTSSSSSNIVRFSLGSLLILLLVKLY